MRKAFIPVALSVATLALAGAVIGISALHAHRVMAASGVPSSHSGAGGAQDNSGAGLTIAFVNNPEPAPPFLTTDLDGNVVSTAAWHNKVVILNFWATWCGPCREEIPILNYLTSVYKDRVLVIGVSMDDDPAFVVKEFARQVGIKYPIMMGSEELAEEYGGVGGLPTAFIINTDGRVVQKHEGVYPTEVYEAEARSLLGLPTNAKVETFDDAGQIFPKNAANASELPGVDMKDLTPEQRTAALKRMNSEYCTCGCKRTIALCRITDSGCATSKVLAAQIVKEVLAASAAPSASTTKSQATNP